MEELLKEFKILFDNKLQDYINSPRLMNSDINILIREQQGLTKEDEDKIWIQIYTTTVNIDGMSLTEVFKEKIEQIANEFDVDFEETLAGLVEKENYNEVIISEIKKGE